MIKEKNLTGWEVADVNYVNDNKSGYYAGILFLVWPLLSLVSAFRNYKTRWAKNILWAFVAFYGFVYAIGPESQGTDIVHYVAEIKYLHGVKMTLGDAVEYYSQGREIDILRTFLAVTISRVTDSQSIITFIYALIFGFFFSRNIWYVVHRLEGKIQPVTILLLACLFFIIPIWNLTTFRMWTAAHIFLYGLLPFLLEGKWKGIVIACCSILVHFSFLIPILVLATYVICGNRLVIYFIFFLTTLFVSEINLDLFNNIVETYAPESIQERTSGYRGEGYVESYRENSGEGRVWYSQWYGRSLKLAIFVFLIVLFARTRNFFTDNDKWLRFFSFILLYYGVANILSSLPSGSRYLSVANFAALALIIFYIQNRIDDRIMHRVVWIMLPSIFLFLIVSIRMGLYSVSAATVLGNPIIGLIFMGENISLNEVLRMIL